MAVIVLVWETKLSDTSFGHAALSLDGNSTCPPNYVSFWPVEKGRFHNFSQDLAWYKPSSQSFWGGKLVGLDESEMKKKFNELKDRTWHWRCNCAWIVHELLEAGGGDEYASWWSSWVIGLWSPEDVHDYAESMIPSLPGSGVLSGSKSRRRGARR